MSEPSLNAEDFKLRDASSYDAVTEAYDRFTEKYTSVLADHIVGLGKVAARDRVLDVATGTGIVALAAAHLAPGCDIVAADLSTGMLDKARRNAAAAGASITFVRADAEALEFPEASFDVVLSLFGLMHFPHPEAAIAQMARVLRPGGRVVVGVGSSPAPFSASQARHALARGLEVVARARGQLLEAPRLIDEICARHIPSKGEVETSEISRSRTHAGTYLPRMMSDVGLEEVVTTWRGCRPTLSTIEDFWELQTTFSSFARKRLTHATPDQLRAVKEEFFSRCRAVQGRGGELIYRYAALFVAARKPART